MTPSLMEEFDRLLQEKTFSVEAAQGIADLKRRAIETEGELTAARADREKYKSDALRYSGQVNELNDKCRDLENRLESANKQIKSLEPAAWEARIAKAESAAYKFALETVFKPAAVRRSVQGQAVIPPAIPNASGIIGPGGYLTPTTETTIESEE